MSYFNYSGELRQELLITSFRGILSKKKSILIQVKEVYGLLSLF